VRAGLVVVGIILLILGAVIFVVPLIPSSQSLSTSSGSGSPDFSIFTSSPLVPTYAKLSYSSPVDVFFEAVTCTKPITTSQADSPNASQDCGTMTTVANSSGTSGSYSFTIPAGGAVVYFAIGDSNSTVSTTLTYTEPLVGIALIALGIILLILGIVLKCKKQKAQAIAAPSTPPPTGGT
jgi:uncharacterized membrane protein